MNENINLCEILKGHEGETFYHALLGKNIKFEETENSYLLFEINCPLHSDGSYIDGGECMLFPSKDQRDWNKWVEEQKSKTPKTWSELVRNKKVSPVRAEICGNGECTYFGTRTNSSIEKSALALLKIHQLINCSYGGNACPCHNRYYSICYDFTDAEFCVRENEHFIIHDLVVIGFHTPEQAEEFLSYPENVQLLKDYFMIN